MNKQAVEADIVLTQADLVDLLHYDPETGHFTRKKSTAIGMKAGDRAHSIDSHGYVRFGVKGRNYRAHRLAWLYMTGEWPKEQIDHINCVRSDNRWANLRAATRTENLRNQKTRSGNKSGFKGVSFNAMANKWVACIRVKRKTIFLGYFESAQAAHEAYQADAVKRFGEFARVA